MDKEKQSPASGPFQDDRRRGIGLPYGSGGFRVRFFERFTAFDLDQVFPEDAPQFQGGGRVILHAVPGRNDFSLALQSRWDEWYLTTPSEELGVSFLPLSPMME